MDDVLSDVYNIEGNVWMQLNRPDSAITDYKKAYEYRLKGKKLHLLPDICINTADAYLHRSDLAHTASYYRRALFLCDSLNLSEHAKIPCLLRIRANLYGTAGFRFIQSLL